MRRSTVHVLERLERLQASLEKQKKELAQWHHGPFLPKEPQAYSAARYAGQCGYSMGTISEALLEIRDLVHFLKLTELNNYANDQVDVRDKFIETTVLYNQEAK